MTARAPGASTQFFQQCTNARLVCWGWGGDDLPTDQAEEPGEQRRAQVPGGAERLCLEPGAVVVEPASLLPPVRAQGARHLGEGQGFSALQGQQTQVSGPPGGGPFCVRRAVRQGGELERKEGAIGQASALVDPGAGAGLVECARRCRLRTCPSVFPIVFSNRN